MRAVTVLDDLLKPWSTFKGCQPGYSAGYDSSSSAMQMPYAPGCDCIFMFTTPGKALPTLSAISLSARPMVALAFQPGPYMPVPELISSCVRIGPLTISSTAPGPVDVW